MKLMENKYVTKLTVAWVLMWLVAVIKEEKEMKLDYDVIVVEKTNSQITFSYDDPNAMDEEHAITFKKGIGISDYYSTAWGGGSRLIKAELK